MIPLALFAAADDVRLGPLALRVYLILHAELDTQRYRPMKRNRLARRARGHWRNIVRAVRQLERLGYLKRGPLVGEPGRQVPSWRLTAPVPPATPPTGGVAVTPPLHAA